MKQLLIGLICLMYFGSCKSKIYTIVEHNPEYPNGQAAFFKYISQNITYPTILRENGMEGTIYIKFVVEKNGSVSNVEIQYGSIIDKKYAENTIKFFKNMPRWKPGYQNGKPVRVSFKMPIRIHLE
jgi:periplasmic protein TonB